MITQARSASLGRALERAAASAALPLRHGRTGRAAGKVSVGFWDHWVSQGNAIMDKRCEALAAAHQAGDPVGFHHLNRSEKSADDSRRRDAQAETGRDIQQFREREAQNHADQSERVDDVMKRLTDKYGPVAEPSRYLFTSKGRWPAVPCSAGNQKKGPCRRISVLRDVAGCGQL